MKHLALATLLFSLTSYAAGPESGSPAPVASSPSAAPTNEELKRQLDVLATEVQKLSTGGAAEGQPGPRVDQSAPQSFWGLGPSASKIYRTSSGVSFGGYGEFIYDNFAGGTHAGVPVSEQFKGSDAFRDTIDLTRAVLYVGYRFDDHWLLNSEFEWEHKGTDDPDGSVNAEFLYLDYLAQRELNFRAGVVLIPMGFINEYHEPPVFLGPHRPEVETYLIPTTWSEAGVGFFGESGPFTYRSYLVTGMNASNFTSTEGELDGPQGGGQAIAESWANVTRIDYTGVPGIMLGGSFYLGNSVTFADPTKGGGIAIPTHIYEAHLEYKYRGLQFRSLGVWTFLGRIADLNAARPLVGEDSVGDVQRGYYFELGYDLLSGERQALIPFARYEDLNTQLEVPTGYLSNPASWRRNVTVGVNFKPIDQVVLKASYKELLLGDASGVNSWSLSFGYVF